jgi:arylsulfatase A
MISKRYVMLAALVGAVHAHASPAPNFVVILGEGAGWSSTSVQMDDANPASKSATVRTPSLDRLASAGMRFANAYAASPRCTPSRAALLTGRSPAALHMTFVGDGRQGERAGEFVNAGHKLLTPAALLELATGETTIAEILRPAGYATAHFGKWHLGHVDPTRHGFDESDGPTGNGGPDDVADPNPKQALVLTARGIDFMTRQNEAGRPFYLQLSHYPSQPEGRDGGGRQKGGGRARTGEAGDADGRGGKDRDASASREMDIVDETVGQLLDAIDRLGLAASTYVIYTTDHGSPGRNPPLNGGKGTVWEGGLRVPFIVRGPGVAAGACSHLMVTQTDLFPTLAELAGIRSALPATIEGGSFAGMLRGGGRGLLGRPREEFVVHFPHYDKDARGPATAIYLGDLKLIRFDETGEVHLFDLARDVAERRDLAGERPEVAADLVRRLDAYLREVGAQMPKANPAHDPSRTPAPTEDRRGGGKKREQGGRP